MLDHVVKYLVQNGDLNLDDPSVYTHFIFIIKNFWTQGVYDEGKQVLEQSQYSRLFIHNHLIDTGSHIGE